MESLEVLRKLIAHLPERLRAMSADQIEPKPAQGKWSGKEELGHLLDSAANNHQRIVRTQLEGQPAMPGYGADEWVRLHRYQEREWVTLIEFWVVLNQQLLVAGDAVPASGWSRTCTIADSAPVTLQFVVDDYIRHLKHHLQHIGVALEDLVPAAAAAP